MDDPIGTECSALAMRRMPRQRRSRQLVEALREACAEILMRQGREGLTSQRVADRAGVDIASLYRYFPNKEAIVALVFEDRLATANRVYRAEAEVEIDPDRGDPRVKLRELAFRIAGHHLEMLDLDSGFYREHFASFDLSRRRRPGGQGSWRLELSSWLATRIEGGAGVGERLAPEAAAFLAFRVLYGAIDAAVLESPGYLRDSAFLEQLSATTLDSLYG